MKTKETTPKAAGLQVRELVKPQKQFDLLYSEVEALCSEYSGTCFCPFLNSNVSPDEATDILF